MNAKLDKMTKSAKSQRRKLSAATEEDTLVGKIREERSQSKQEEVSVWGPYRDGPTRFRLKISEKGEVRNVCYKTREDAETVKSNLLAQAEDRQECTVGAAVTAFCQYLEETRCIKEDSVRGAAQKLAWLPADALLVSIKPEQAERLYRELVQSVNPRNKKPPSTATQRARLTTARYFFSWAQKSGLCRQNPFASVQPIGRMNVGKKQLRIDEARRFEAVCLKQAESGDTAAFGALLMIYLGLRQSEVAARVKRDIDDEGEGSLDSVRKDQECKTPTEDSRASPPAPSHSADREGVRRSTVLSAEPETQQQLLLGPCEATLSTRRRARNLSPQSARSARDAGAGGRRNRGLCCQSAGSRLLCDDRPPLRHRVQRARRAVQPSLFRPCRSPRFTDRVGSLTEGAPRRTTPGTLRLPPYTVFRSSAARRQTPDISVSRTVPRVLLECQFLDGSGIFGGLHQTLPPVEKPGKTSLLLSEKVREVFLPHWSITKNLAAPSTRRYKTKSSRSRREQVLS